MKYWIGVVSRQHVKRGLELGIAQIGHGKRSSLVRMKAGDWLIYYSPREHMDDARSLQAFTAIGQIADETIWQADEGDFHPWRRTVTYSLAEDTPIRPLLDHLSFSAGKANWGASLRFGLLEITKQDFTVIAKAMRATI